ncbi:Hypothetical predicted protein, partial [Paramuricea clavata]
RQPLDTARLLQARQQESNPSTSTQLNRQTTLAATAHPQLSVTRSLPSLFVGSGVQFENASNNLLEIPIPRGVKRAHLAEIGLIGKVSINATWTEEEVARELTSVFATSFNLECGELLPSDYLG